jgi:hypothetical protein
MYNGQESMVERVEPPSTRASCEMSRVDQMPKKSDASYDGGFDDRGDVSCIHTLWIDDENARVKSPKRKPSA